MMLERVLFFLALLMWAASVWLGASNRRKEAQRKRERREFIEGWTGRKVIDR